MKTMEFHIPETMAGLDKLIRNNSIEGALSLKTKELIALSLAVHAGNSDCALMQLREALQAGASDDEICETVEVAVMMGGRPSLVTGSDVVAAMSELSREDCPQLLYDHLSD